MNKFCVAIVLFCTALLVSAAPINIGPPLGSKVPDLSAVDSSSASRNLASLSGTKGAVLVFFRSADWCPFCQVQLMSLKDVVEPLNSRGYQLVAISYDSIKALASFTKKRKINYTLLSDVGSKTIDAFGIRNPEYAVGHFAYGVPLPAIFIVSPTGVLRGKLAVDGYRDRPENDAILEAIDKLPN